MMLHFSDRIIFLLAETGVNTWCAKVYRGEM
jgi:hypothetical protein